MKISTVYIFQEEKLFKYSINASQKFIISVWVEGICPFVYFNANIIKYLPQWFVRSGPTFDLTKVERPWRTGYWILYCKSLCCLNNICLESLCPITTRDIRSHLTCYQQASSHRPSSDPKTKRVCCWYNFCFGEAFNLNFGKERSFKGKTRVWNGMGGITITTCEKYMFSSGDMFNHS